MSPPTLAHASETLSEMTAGYCPGGQGLKRDYTAKAKPTHNVLATDTEDPADEVQDFLHRNGHRSPKLRAREPEQRDPQNSHPN